MGMCRYQAIQYERGTSICPNPTNYEATQRLLVIFNDWAEMAEKSSHKPPRSNFLLHLKSEDCRAKLGSEYVSVEEPYQDCSRLELSHVSD